MEPALKLEPEYQEAFGELQKNPTNDSRQKFLTIINPVINKYLGSVPQSNRELLKTQAQLLAIKALPHYRPDLSSLNTFLGQQFMGLRRKTRQQDPANIIRQPEHIQLLQQKLYEEQNKFQDEYGRAPSTQELADKTGISQKNINRIKSRKGSISYGSLNREGDDGENVALPAVKTNISFKAQVNYVYNELEPTDQFILEHSQGFSHLFNNHSMSNAELAKNTGLSLASISQKKARMQKLLDSASEAY